MQQSHIYIYIVITSIALHTLWVNALEKVLYYAARRHFSHLNCRRWRRRRRFGFRDHDRGSRFRNSPIRADGEIGLQTSTWEQKRGILPGHGLRRWRAKRWRVEGARSRAGNIIVVLKAQNVLTVSIKQPRVKSREQLSIERNLTAQKSVIHNIEHKLLKHRQLERERDSLPLDPGFQRLRPSQNLGIFVNNVSHGYVGSYFFTRSGRIKKGRRFGGGNRQGMI